MKTSNKLLIALSLILTMGILVTDNLLKAELKNINLNDPFKNYEAIKTLAFKSIKIRGGNGYSIRIQQAADYGMKVMKSRKGFLKTNTNKDTLSINFDVSNAPVKAIDNLPVGLIISCPDVSTLNITGTSVIINGLKLDSLHISQSGNSITSFKNITIDNLTVEGRERSLSYFESNNLTNYLIVYLSGNAVMNMEQINFKRFKPELKDKSSLILSSNTIALVKNFY